METQQPRIHPSTSRLATVSSEIIAVVDNWDTQGGSWYAQFANRRSVRALGRALTVVFFALLMAGQTLALMRLLDTDEQEIGNLRVALMAFHHLLQAIFVGLAAFLVIFRRSVRAGTARFSGIVTALVGTFVASLLVIDGVDGLNDNLIPLAVPVLLLGMAWATWSLRALGRCFSILPEVRGLVTSGPYRWVRHPIYLGEMVAVFGLVIPILSSRNVAVFLVFCALQLWRARFEEKGLASTFPEYDDYRRRTARLLPGLW